MPATEACTVPFSSFKSTAQFARLARVPPPVCEAVVKPAFRRDSMRSANVGFFGCSLRKNIRFIIAGRRLVRFFTPPNEASGLYFKSSDVSAGGPMMNYSRNLYVTALLLTEARLASAAPPTNAYLVHPLAAPPPAIADFPDPNLVHPWGYAPPASSPLWLAYPAAGLSTLYTSHGTP